ncbi:MAG TPA: hypothetical protein VGE26_11215 [Sphingobacteriaceae bacterium]
MKATKAKTVKQAEKKSSRKTFRKELETNITDKLTAAIKNLGHNADIIAEDIRKIGKRLAKKLIAVSSETSTADLKLDKKKVDDTKPTGKKELNKAQKVVEKATKATGDKSGPRKLSAGVRLPSVAVTATGADTLTETEGASENSHSKRKKVRRNQAGNDHDDAGLMNGHS